ncbi:DNA repair protein rad2 [Dissophora globulifera]|uniref:DNA repair protein rad2 n=1 Tax=Dissophora globulifera TaxID=979702 RepID=A0A9P6RG74_9FUNG|nr:DNA repair protein rad2 [Dissophora globulifera]
MGVKGLWELLHPVARPIKLETLANKHLAIDASIWLHQFLRGMRDKEGQVIGNAHIIGFFRRICKLLYYNVKPIFVFDGGTPALKRLTIQERRKRKKQDANMVKRTAEKLLAAQLRLRALELRKAGRKKKEQEKLDQEGGVVHDSEANPKYLSEIDQDDKSSLATGELSAEQLKNEAGIGSQAKRIKDRYLLPPMEVDFDTLSKIRSNDERFGYQAEDEVSKFLDEFKTEGGVANIDSDVFKALPSEVQYEILHDIRLRSRVTSYERVQEMVRLSNTPMDFSKLQVQGVMRRNIVTHKLLSVNQAVSKMDEVAKPGRIASQRNRQYILIKNEEGGWVLGGKKPTTGTTIDKPVQLDSDEEREAKVKDEDEENWVSDDDDDDDTEFEEVKIPQAAPIPTSPSTLRSQAQIKETPVRPLQPHVAARIDDSNSLINHLEAYVDEDESIEKVMAKFAEMENGAARKANANGKEKNGVHLIGEQDVIHVQDGARQHLAKAGLRLKDDAQWTETISDGEELASLETLHSDNTLDFDDLEDMIEDEETGEIVSRHDYNKRHRQDESNDTGRALSTEQESQLDPAAFHNYWTGYTPDSFKERHHDYEWMIRDAIYDWDKDRIETEIHSATRKLEKSSVNDTDGVKALGFWNSFLTAVLARQLAQGAINDIKHVTDTSLGEKQGANVTKERKSRLSQAILLDDDEDDDSHAHMEEITAADFLLSQQGSGSPITGVVSQDIVAPISAPKTVVELTDVTKSLQGASEQTEKFDLPHRPILDFSSSILKRKTPSAAVEPTSERITAEMTSTLDLASTNDSTLSTAKSTLIQDVPLFDSSSLPNLSDAAPSDSGVGSLPSGPDSESESDMEPISRRSSEPLVTGKDTATLSGDVVISDEDKLAVLDKDIAATEAGLLLDVAEDEEDDEDNDEAHEADLENEEQDFTNLFPDMANLPGAILNPKEPSPRAETSETRLHLSPEERQAQEQQDVQRMVDESRKLESEIKDLQDQHRKHQRNADDLTEGMVAETQVLLRLFGIPYLVAPMEAEAQCADLQLRGVVDGILTEDSDVFLFGGARVFKNMFREEKFVECYLMSDVERDLGVGRERLVALAYLLGSDYTTGIKGVGLITAMEIIRLFPKLENFARWWRGEQHKSDGDKSINGENNDSGLTEQELDSMDEVALEKLAKQCKKIHLPSSFPDPHIGEAYIRPLVDDDPTKFQWGIPDLDGLRDFLRRSLDWDRGEVDRVLLPIIRQMSSAQLATQTTLDTFFDNSVGMGSFNAPIRKNLHKSARLRKVVDGLTRQRSGNAGSQSDTPSEDQTQNNSGNTKTSNKKAPAKRKPTAKRAKRASKAGNGAEGMNQEIEAADDDREGEESEEGFVDELEKKKQRLSQTASKKTKTAQTKVPEAVTAAKQQLRSKNVEARLAERNRNRAAAAAAATTESEAAPGIDSPIRGRKRSNDRSGSSSSSNSSGDDHSDDEEQVDFARSHWDLFAEKQRMAQQQQQAHSSPKAKSAPTVVSGAASSLTAMVSATNSARYGTSFRNKETGGSKKTSLTSPSKKTRRVQ